MAALCVNLLDDQAGNANAANKGGEVAEMERIFPSLSRISLQTIETRECVGKAWSVPMDSRYARTYSSMGSAYLPDRKHGTNIPTIPALAARCALVRLGFSSLLGLV